MLTPFPSLSLALAQLLHWVAALVDRLAARLLVWWLERVNGPLCGGAW